MILTCNTAGDHLHNSTDLAWGKGERGRHIADINSAQPRQQYKAVNMHTAVPQAYQLGRWWWRV